MISPELAVVVAYHSGYGHTLKIAQAVHAGAASVAGTRAVLLNVAEMKDADWNELNEAQAIIFGAPTYMGGASGPFKMFADASSKVWFTQGWKDKVAGGFTCSLSMSGEKQSTLGYLQILAMQHGMIWVGTGIPPSQKPGDPETLNRLGSAVGVMAQADNVPPEQSPPSGDVETARLYGERVAKVALKLGRK
jgi:NAD(P)H dehydrogenase (quinone)